MQRGLVALKWQMTINNNKEELWADSWAQLMEQM
jgi:hypothetical protein